jgi:hypothetical protein
MIPLIEARTQPVMLDLRPPASIMGPGRSRFATPFGMLDIIPRQSALCSHFNRQAAGA